MLTAKEAKVQKENARDLEVVAWAEKISKQIEVDVSKGFVKVESPEPPHYLFQRIVKIFNGLGFSVYTGSNELTIRW